MKHKIGFIGMGLIGGPIVGFIATKIKSPSKTILGGFILSIAVLVGFILFPQDPSGAMVASILVVVFGFTTYGAFSIGSSPLSRVYTFRYSIYSSISTGSTRSRSCTVKRSIE